MTLYNTNYTPSGSGWTVVKSPTSPPTTASWTLSGTCVAASTMAQTMRNGMNGFSAFGTAVSNNPLPVELLSFTGRASGTVNILEWITATELNNDFFTVERSKDGIQFEEIAMVDGAGNSTSATEYSATDKYPFAVTYYRLRQNDFDGSFTFSEIIAVQNKTNKLSITNIHPNPTTGKFEFEIWADVESKVTVAISDEVGRILKQDPVFLTQGFNRLQSDLREFSNGIYYMTLTGETEHSIVRKIIRY
jgi:hypothetical protein